MNKIMPFAEALKDSRKKKKMTQTELADRVGISAMSISRYESGESIPDMGILASICVALKDDSLLDSWTYNKRKNNGGETLNERNTFFKVKDITYRKYWDELVRSGTWQFKKRLVYIAQYLQNMNGQGFRKTMEIIEAFSLIPDYKDETGWAFTQNPAKEGLIYDEGETESE